MTIPRNTPLLTAIGRFVLPPQCVCCAAPLDGPADNGAPLACELCLSDMFPKHGDQCRRCSAPVGPNVDTTKGCQTCRDLKFAFTDVVSLGVYSGPLRSAILRMKRGSGDPLAAMTAQLLARTHHSRLAEWAADLIVPVPHYWIERLLRPHFPPMTMAAVLGGSLKVPVDTNILRKRRWTRKQALLSADDRRRNVKDAYRVGRGIDLQGASVILVDDVLTTGATADRAAHALRDAGAGSVHVVVAGRAIRVETSLPG